jgi:hypothetical protein
VSAIGRPWLFPVTPIAYSSVVSGFCS